MQHTYKVRTHESGDQDGATEAGTLVLRLGGSNTVEARYVDEAEDALRKQLGQHRLLCGRVYQIVPPAGSSESLRTLAFALDGSSRACLLDPAKGFNSQFCTIRFPAVPAK